MALAATRPPARSHGSGAGQAASLTKVVQGRIFSVDSRPRFGYLNYRLQNLEGKGLPKEATIVAAIVREAKERGHWVMKVHGGPFQLAGVPDLLCIKRGVATFLEVKQPGKKPTVIQERRMAEIERVGGALCHVVTSREEAAQYL